MPAISLAISRGAFTFTRRAWSANFGERTFATGTCPSTLPSVSRTVTMSPSLIVVFGNSKGMETRTPSASFFR